MIAAPLPEKDEDTGLEAPIGPKAPSQGQFLLDGGTSDLHNVDISVTSGG